MKNNGSKIYPWEIPEIIGFPNRYFTTNRVTDSLHSAIKIGAQSEYWPREIQKRGEREREREREGEREFSVYFTNSIDCEHCFVEKYFYINIFYKHFYCILSRF